MKFILHHQKIMYTFAHICLSAASLYGSLLHFVSVVLKRVEKYSTVRDAGTHTVNISLCL